MAALADIMGDQEIQEVLQAIELEVTDLISQLEAQGYDVEDLRFKAESVLAKVVLLEAVVTDVAQSNLVPAMFQMLSAVQALVEDHHRSRLRGRPQIQISEEQITLLLDSFHCSGNG